MKIMLLITNLKFGGAERICSLIANELSSRGYEVVLVLKKDEIHKKKYYISNDVSIINLNTTYFNFIIKLFKCIKKEKPHKILSFLTPMNVSLLLLRKMKLIKSKIIIRETTIKSISNAKKNIFKKNVMNFLIRYTYNSADKIIAISNGCKTDLKDFYKINEIKIELIYNPISIEKVRMLGNEELSSNLNLEYKKTIICVGSFVYSKGHKYLIDALRILNQRGSYYNLLLIGEGVLEEQIKNYAQTILEKNQLKIIGHTSNPFKYIKKSELFVLPALWEGFGNVLIESMAVGTPVISTTCESGPKEIINNNINGILVKEKESEQLADSIDLIFKDNILKERIISNASSSVKNYDVKIIIPQYENLIKNI